MKLKSSIESHQENYHATRLMKITIFAVMAFETALMTINSEMVFMPIPTQENGSFLFFVFVLETLSISVKNEHLQGNESDYS